PILEATYCEILNYGAVPAFIGEGFLKLIPKKDKDRLNLSNYRPITLLNTSYKILTGIINSRLVKILPSIICGSQKGFMKGRRAEDIPRSIQDLIDRSLNHGRDFATLLVDFNKAFDSISHKFIFSSLLRYGFPMGFINMVGTILRDSFSWVASNGRRLSFEITQGCKQGDPISPSLFLLAVNNLFHLISQAAPPRLTQMYADDLSVFYEGTCEEISSSIKMTFKVLNNYATHSGLVMNETKTEVLTSIQSSLVESFPSLKYSSSAILLGITISKNGSETAT
ncbi:Uncharacterized protein FKW44_003913, partial [Caligus rogercresseyi]